MRSTTALESKKAERGETRWDADGRTKGILEIKSESILRRPLVPGQWVQIPDASEPPKLPIFEPRGTVDPDGQRMRWSNGDHRREPSGLQLDTKLIPADTWDASIFHSKSNYSVECGNSLYFLLCSFPQMALFPLNMLPYNGPLWHSDYYFVSKVFEKQLVQKGHSDPPSPWEQKINFPRERHPPCTRRVGGILINRDREFRARELCKQTLLFFHQFITPSPFSMLAVSLPKRHKSFLYQLDFFESYIFFFHLFLSLIFLRRAHMQEIKFVFLLLIPCVNLITRTSQRM